ncbi:UNVERIFIED_CONTAM: hypothetical protein GTU68_032239, partial [Idotea baltica]|nr:hypothetical protein [Idotea baltica]
MLDVLGEPSLQSLIKKIVPANILIDDELALDDGVDESAALEQIRKLASRNKVLRSLIGMGYHDCHTPSVIRRNVIENPSWYTAYTPYQPEIAQGRLEALFNFQTLVTELTAMPIANASLLDEGTAAAEAMAMAHRSFRGKRSVMLVADDLHPQSLDVLRTRATPLQIELVLAALSEKVFAVLVQYPGTCGEVIDLAPIASAAHEHKALLAVAADPLSLMLLPAPGDAGADIVIGSMQRFGVPMGFGGPHAAYMATTDKLKRSLPGRLVGQSITVSGETAYRLALQTREQHIRREMATSNICTAQALLAIVATFYACYHGPAGLQAIAQRVRRASDTVAATVQKLGLQVLSKHWFDTLQVQVASADKCVSAAEALGYNIRKVDDTHVAVSFDETSTISDQQAACAALAQVNIADIELSIPESRDSKKDRELTLLTQACFNSYHSETDMMRYLRELAAKDIALDRSMIPLGSCTMKLNAASEMTPITWPEFSDIHPFAPANQTQGYRDLITDLENMLCECTGYDAMSLQPNAGSQGEYAGLLAIQRYHQSRGDKNRTKCLIPASAHGTNPASAHMVGLSVVLVACDDAGNVDVEDLQAKLDEHGDDVAAIMITYPSTHGVFETEVRDVCERVHAVGGQVYIDGANLNAMVGVAKPGQFGGDVSHLNLHKTFCIPHGGGGPGVGPIGVGAHLKAFMPGHRELPNTEGAVSAAPWGSAMILPITWMYIRMMGKSGLQHATAVAMLHANYIAHKLQAYYPILFRGEDGFVAHECILDTRRLKKEAGISVDDLAKRLMDYGFHAPTMSFPVAGTLMVEPTESESQAEIDRFVEAMLSIHAEACKVRDGEWPADNNPLVNAPHTAYTLLDDEWNRPYSRHIAAYPAGEREGCDKYWPPVSRIDNV